MAASTRTTIIMLVLALAAAGCGRKPAQLDTPYQAARDARREAEKNKQPLPPEPEKPVEDKPFILDSLI